MVTERLTVKDRDEKRRRTAQVRTRAVLAARAHNLYLRAYGPDSDQSRWSRYQAALADAELYGEMKHHAWTMEEVTGHLSTLLREEYSSLVSALREELAVPRGWEVADRARDLASRSEALNDRTGEALAHWYEREGSNG